MRFLQLLNSLSSEALSWWKNCSHFMFLTVIFIFLSSCWIITRKWKTKSPPLPPGPRGLPLVGNLLCLDPELHTYFTGLSRKYGPIFSRRLGTKLCVVVSSSEAAREVLKDNDVVFANHDQPAVTKVIFDGKDIVWTPYGPLWRMLRKVCVKEMFSTSILDSFYYLRQREIRKTIAHLYSHAGCPVIVSEQIFLTGFNVMMKMLWGGSGEMGTMGAEFQQVVTDLTYLLGVPNLSDFFPILAPLDLQGRAKQMRRIVVKLERIYHEFNDGREKIGERGKHSLQVLLESRGEGAEKITMNHVKGLLTGLLVGATDTISSTMEFVMSELMITPRVMAKAQEELDTIVGKNSTVEETHIPKLPYLNAIIKESL